MSLMQLPGNVHVGGRLTCTNFTPPSGCIGNAAVASDADVAASKLQHQHALHHKQVSGTDVVTATEILHICRGVGVVVDVEVTSAVCPDADTDFYTVMIQRVRAGAPANVLTGVITYNNTNAPANWTILTGTIDGGVDDLADGDMLQSVVTVTNNGGSQSQGLCVTVTIRELAG